MSHTEALQEKIFRSILDSRKKLVAEAPLISHGKAAEEGGCGVVGFAASVPVGGRHIFEPSVQMHNRGNGKGGGIACACLNPKQLGLDETTLRNDYILQIALIDPQAEKEIEEQFVAPHFRIDHKTSVKAAVDWRELGLPVQPPDIVRYFVRVADDPLARFARENALTKMPERDIEDEFVYQNSVRLNQQFYASLGDKRAFVLSHARNLMIFKIVGYAEQVVQYYGLEDFQAQIWIAHQRYPTKGRVWHPAGAHPFIGMNEALVHNGDFANYHSVSEYLRQHHIATQFLTDTEVSALLFDLLSRTYQYPLEYVIEALAPTIELDFDMLPVEKQRVYRMIQSMHVHSSPDGPWFFIIAQSRPDEDMYRLIGITDTAMLRPQVFAIQEGDVSIGLVASEKQAIDATLHSLSQDDSRFRPVADRYWNARGGSHTDGGAFSFTLKKNTDGFDLSCADKFGKLITVPDGEYRINLKNKLAVPAEGQKLIEQVRVAIASGKTEEAFSTIVGGLKSWGFDQLRWLLGEIEQMASHGDDQKEGALALLTLLNDRRYDCGRMRHSSVLELVRSSIDAVLDSVPMLSSNSNSRFARIDWDSRHSLRKPERNEKILVIYAQDFPPEGDECDSQLAVRAFERGWNRFIVYGLKGQRFHGCAFGPHTEWVRFDIYGSSGDYLASGIDGMEIHVHNNAQDQLGQIMKKGRLVVYGDVGQTFMYGAKGGEIYIMGNAAGRPLINAVGKPRVVINGTCLDFLAESFMAGDPHKGGGFVVLNGVEFDDHGRVREQPTPYPGSNLFSLASGGAIFVRDPHRKLVEEQLNGGEFAQVDDKDWQLILPYLQKNEELFGISVERDLLTVNGQMLSPGVVYRKVRPASLAVLAKTPAQEKVLAHS
ncbi:MAG: glutamate synthase [Dehalococcoidia bacterium]|nr:glutamate synthase [Dehalococcoidia bacterium]